MTREKKLSLCSCGDALKESSHPDPLIFDNGPPDGSAWYLELIKKIEQPTVLSGTRLPFTREKLLDEFWPELLVLALCHSGFFNIVEVAESVPGWSIEVSPVLDMSDNSPWWGYSAPNRDSAEWADEFYGISDWQKFNQCLELITNSLRRTVDAKSWEPTAIFDVARWNLRGRLIEHPQVESDTEYTDTYADVLLHYVIGLEKLLMLPSESDAISEKIAIRGAWLVGRSDSERANLSELIKRTYNARSTVVHRTNKKKDQGKAAVEFRRIRDLCRRAMAVALIVSANLTKEQSFDKFLKRLPISQEAQKLAEDAAWRIGELSRCW